MGMVLRIILAIVAVVVLFFLWYIAARPLALATESFSAQTLPSPQIDRIGWNGTYLRINNRIRGLTGSDDKAILQLSVDAAHHLVATTGGHTIVLGTESAKPLPDDNETIPAFAADPGDHITLTRTRGRIAWANWFSFTLGNSPSWKRFVTDRLVWTKASGATLTLLWRYEEYYYDSEGRWVGADMMGSDSCGLVKAEITP
jgi:hypothetical protein